VTVLDISDEDFKLWVRTEISGDNPLNVEAAQAALSYVGIEAGRNLTVVTSATAATALHLRPRTSCTDVLWIQDAASITSVVENGVTLVDGTDYIAEPYGNKDEATGEWKPFDRLYRLDSWWYADGRRRTVVVTAKWGWSTVHPLAREAVKVLGKDWLQQRDLRGGVVATGPEGFSIGARMNPMVLGAIKAISGPLSIGIA